MYFNSRIQGAGARTAQHSRVRCASAAAEAPARGQSMRVSRCMQELKEKNRVAFIPYLCAGDPNMSVTKSAIQKLDAANADIIELGVPYSDPLADGPVIQSAASRALSKGSTLDSVLDMLSSVTPDMSAPVVLFSYYNIIAARGLDLFCKQVKDAGVSGVLVPDLPLEETHEIRAACSKVGLEVVLIVTPTTPVERMKAIADASEGFVYLASVAGVTGVRGKVNEKLEGLISTLHSVTDKPVAVGFGVSGPEQAQTIVSNGAEGVIVGSALVKALANAPSDEEGLQKMEDLAINIRAAIP